MLKIIVDVPWWLVYLALLIPATIVAVLITRIVSFIRSAWLETNDQKKRVEFGSFILSFIGILLSIANLLFMFLYKK